MMHGALGALEQTPRGDWARVYYLRSGEEIKVSIHALHALLGLITQQLGDYGYFSHFGWFCTQGNLLSDFKSVISEADIPPRQERATGHDIVDDTDSLLPNNPAFNSFLASLAPQLMDAYLVTRVDQFQRKSCA